MLNSGKRVGPVRAIDGGRSRVGAIASTMVAFAAVFLTMATAAPSPIENKVGSSKKGVLVGRFTIVAYTPKTGKEPELIAAVRKHLDVLRAEQLVTDKPGYVMRAGDGTIVEVFEWRSVESIKQAHTNPAVQALWAEFGLACDYTPLGKLKESQDMFAEFDAVAF